MFGFEMNAETKSKVLEDLKSVGCCHLCGLRYVGVRDKFQYQNEFSRDGISDVEQQVKKFKSNPCIVCVGVLQDLCSASEIEKIRDDMVNYGCDDSTFTPALSFPISFQIRSFSLELYLLEKFNDVYSKMDFELEVASVKEVWKWIAGVHLAELTKKQLLTRDDGQFLVGIHVSYDGDTLECEKLLELDKERYEKRAVEKRKHRGETFTRKSVDDCLKAAKTKKFKKFISVPPEIPSSHSQYGRCTFNHESIHLAGRYNKFSRKLSQTPWLVEGLQARETSVQELIGQQLIDAAGAESTRFSSSGREDVDVRTLGRGRPFAMELLNPRLIQFASDPAQLAILQRGINQSSCDIQIRDLQLVSKDDLKPMKEGEEHKTKTYRALCVCHQPIPLTKLMTLNSTEELVLQQKTPIRVLHRRPLSVRERVIHWVKVRPLSPTVKHSIHDSNVVDNVKIEVPSSKSTVENGHDTDPSEVKYFELDVKTQAGTYVKEFVHGDFGRTLPNVCTMLGTSVDILALDVTEIGLDWPPVVKVDE